MKVRIRELTAYDEFVRVQRLHQQIWGMKEGAGLYPPLLKTASQNGGVVLGAFIDSNMVGFAFGFVGIHKGKTLKLCSQTMGITSEYRNLGVGEQLKWAQREKALRRDLPLITWTYDPLEASNAYLNLHKLGAISNSYQINVYGEDFLKFGAGLPSDRFIVEWWLNSERVVRRENLRSALEKEISLMNYPSINPSSKSSKFRRIQTLNLEQSEELLLCEIPANMQELKKSDRDLALDWRMKTRRALKSYFEIGYFAVDVIRKKDGDEQRVYYILSLEGDFVNEHKS